MRDKEELARQLDKEWMRVKNELEHGDLGVEFDTFKDEVLDNLSYEVDGNELSASYDGYGLDSIEFNLPDTTDLEVLLGEAVLALRHAEEGKPSPYAVLEEAGFTLEHVTAILNLMAKVDALNTAMHALTGHGLDLDVMTLMATRSMLENMKRELEARATTTTAEEVNPMA